MTWKLVPTTPTDEMYEAAYELVEKRKGLWGWDKQVKSPGDLWTAMLSASPDPTTDEALVERVKDAIGYQMAAVVSRNNQPHMSGDPRNRIPPALRRIFDESVRDAALAAIRAMEEKP